MEKKLVELVADETHRDSDDEMFYCRHDTSQD